jgi:hypothetical protein
VGAREIIKRARHSITLSEGGPGEEAQLNTNSSPGGNYG